MVIFDPVDEGWGLVDAKPAIRAMREVNRALVGSWMFLPTQPFGIEPEALIAEVDRYRRSLTPGAPVEYPDRSESLSTRPISALCRRTDGKILFKDYNRSLPKDDESLFGAVFWRGSMVKLNKGIVLGVLAGALVASGYALGLAGTLVIDGRSTPADVRTLNGTAYVRLADVAKALDMTVVARGNRYELTKAGGANAIGGRAGKIGDTLFDGKWRFTVLSVDTPSEYAMKTDAQTYNERDAASYDSRSHTVKPGRNFGLVVLKVRVANGTKTRKTLWTAISDERIHTAIADTDGGSHSPIAYDFSGGPTQTEGLLPGAAMTFNVVFSLPTDTRPKDLVFTLKNNQGDDGGNDVRVSLAGS